MHNHESELRERFPLRTAPFEHNAFRVEILLPESADALIDVSDFNLDERLPYWADLWPSARAIARYVLDNPPAASTRTIELGCGVALPSLALRSLGREVLATDYFPDALAFAQVNAERNALGPLPTELLNWRKPLPELGRFGLVIAADVLYEIRNGEALASLLPELVAPGGRVWVADPGRMYAAAFRDRMAGEGWVVHEVARFEEPVTAETPSTVAIWELLPPT